MQIKMPRDVSSAAQQGHQMTHVRQIRLLFPEGQELLERGGSGGRSGKRASKKTERPVIGEYFTPVQARGLLPANVPGLHVTINAGAQW